METVHGLSSRSGSSDATKSFPRTQNQRSFFGETKDCNTKRNVNWPCKVCGKQHAIWMCRDFLKMGISERWSVAKRYNLCFRCLGEGHRGKICLRSRTCGLNGCTEVHNRLLRSYDIGQESKDGKSGANRNICNENSLNSTFVEQSSSGDNLQIGSATEGKQTSYREKPQITMVSQAHIKPDFIGLRAVPVILKNGNRQLKVNALLDDANTKT